MLAQESRVLERLDVGCDLVEVCGSLCLTWGTQNNRVNLEVVVFSLGWFHSPYSPAAYVCSALYQNKPGPFCANHSVLTALH